MNDSRLRLERDESRLRKAFDKALEALTHLKQQRRNQEKNLPLGAAGQPAGFVLQEFLKGNAAMRQHLAQRKEMAAQTPEPQENPMEEAA